MPKALFSKAGFILCALYLTVAVPSLLLSFFSADPKGNALLGALSILPAGLVVTCLGLWPTVLRSPWLNNGFIWIPASLLTCYAIGWLFTLLGRVIMNLSDATKETDK
jgi:hypothetical protein